MYEEIPKTVERETKKTLIRNKFDNSKISRVTESLERPSRDKEFLIRATKESIIEEDTYVFEGIEENAYLDLKANEAEGGIQIDNLLGKLKEQGMKLSFGQKPDIENGPVFFMPAESEDPRECLPISILRQDRVMGQLLNKLIFISRQN